MEKTTLHRQIEAADEGTLQRLFTELERSGNLTHIKPILSRITTLTDKELKKAGVTAAARILKRDLVNNYSELDIAIRQDLTTVLKKLDPSISYSLAAMLGSPDQNIRFNALLVLKHTGGDRHITTIVKNLLNDNNHKIRATAVSILKDLSGFTDNDNRIIAKLLNDKNERVVANMIEAISETADQRLLSLILRFKSHPNNRIRGNTLKALWFTGRQNVNQNLDKMINDKINPAMRATACWVIGECATKTDYYHVHLLESCIDGPEEIVRKNAIKALLKINSPKAQEMLQAKTQPEEIEKIQQALNAAKNA